MVQRVKGCSFLSPRLGHGLTLRLAFGILRCGQLCQGAGPQVFLRDMPVAPDTAVIVRLRASLFPGHCATLFVVRQTFLPHTRAPVNLNHSLGLAGDLHHGAGE